jgi:hypothetical protein
MRQIFGGLVGAAVALLGLACSEDDTTVQGLCTPGQIIFCTGPGACPGTQVCAADGTGYGLCSCGSGGSGAAGGAAGAGGGGASAPGSCSDGILNGGETDVDCGGDATGCPRCAIDQACADGTDCESSLCVNQVCQPVPTGATYYISPDGSDETGDGSFAAPWFTLAEAWAHLAAGDMLYCRGGTYEYSVKQTLSGANGTSADPIRIWAYPGETPNFTKASVFDAGDWPQVLIFFLGDWFHWKSIEISNMVQTGSSPNESAGGMCIYDADNNVFERFDYHHNAEQLHIDATSTGNLVLNSDFHHNSDPYSVDTYGNADGIAVNFTEPGTSNTIRGCRMWWNSDDGVDMYSNDGEVLVENSWAFYNGYVPDTFDQGGDGNGFKSGKSDATYSSVMVTYKNCLAYKNRTVGFHQNGLDAPVAIYNSIAYLNEAQGYWFGEFDHPNVFTNDVDYANGGEPVLVSGTVTTSTFLLDGSNDSSFSVTDADFESLVESELTAPRKADGSLPDITFLHLAAGSDLIDSGTDVGIPYLGDAPDLGPFERE